MTSHKIRLMTCAFTTLLLVALVAPATAAAYVVPLSLSELTALADTVAEVRVSETGARATRAAGRVSRIDTDIRMQVGRTYKGDARDRLTLIQPGGTADGVTLSVSDMPIFEPGDRAIVFIDANGVVGGWQGKLDIVDSTVPALGMTLAEARQAIADLVRTGSTDVEGSLATSPDAPSTFSLAEEDAGITIASTPVTLFNSTFEGGSMAGWSTIGDPTWAPTTRRAAAGSWALYGAGGGSSGVSAPGPVPVSVRATAKRTSAVDLRPYDIATLSWDVWTGLSSSSSNWANVQLATSPNGPWITPQGTFAMYSGYGWRNFSLDLRHVTDQWSKQTYDFTTEREVWIQFYFRHTDGATDEGVYVDNAKLTAQAVPTPAIDFITPAFANAGMGEEVTIYGSGFGATRGTGHVRFLLGNRQDGSTVHAPVVSWSADRIVVEVPWGAQSGPVQVVDGSGVSSAGYFYDVGFGLLGYGTWAANAFPVTFRIAENCADTIGERAAIVSAMQTWSTAGSNLRFVAGGSTNTEAYPAQRDGFNDIYFTSTPGPTGVVALCYVWPSSTPGRLAETDVVFFDNPYTWSIGAEIGKIDIESVALHELGHAVGLADQYAARDRAMGVAPAGENVRTLHPVEVLGAMYLYGLDGTVEPPRLLTVEPIAGTSRFATAVQISKRAYPDGLAPDGVRTVVLATGRNWPDALGGTSLAGALDGPVLLVDRASVPAVVAAEIDRLGAERAIILGGPSAVSESVEAAVAAQLGDPGRVDRIAGGSRYETADKVAARVKELLGGAWDGTALVATGANYPDALAVSPLAAANGWPLLLAHPTRGLADATVAVMGEPDRVLLLGGTGAVSEPVEADLRGRFAAAEVRRLAGGDRYSTAVTVARFGVEESGLSWDGVAVATGQNFPDALAGGVLQGKRGSVMVLTRTTSICSTTSGTLSAHRAEIERLSYLGGTGAVCDSVRATVNGLLQ